MAAISRTSIPSHWPKWNRQCDATRYDGKRCFSYAVRGADKCKKHGGGGPKTGKRAWQRYLLFVLMPEWAHTKVMSPVLDEEVELVCQIIAEAALTGTPTTSTKMKMQAAEALLQSVSVATHPDPALLLTHLSREQAQIAVDILYLNGLLKRHVPQRVYTSERTDQ